jgi:hypothetical protein
VQIIFSGSGTVRSNGTACIGEKVAYLEELGRQIYALRDSGLSARRIRRRLLGREPSLTYLTFGHFSGRRLVASYLSESTERVPVEAEKGDGEASPKPALEAEPAPPAGEDDHRLA